MTTGNADALAEVVRLRKLIERGRATPLSHVPELSEERANELVRHIAAGRA